MPDLDTLAAVRSMLADRVCNQLQVLLTASSEAERHTVARTIRAIITTLSPETLNEWQETGMVPPTCSV